MDGTVWAQSAMVAARTRLEIATENLANVSTDGYRRVGARGFLTALGVSIAREPSPEAGGVRHTGRDLDLALVGASAFRVAAGSGRTELTRAGAFVRATNGTLRDVAGRTLQGRHGALHFPAGATLDSYGRVVSGGQILDALPLPPGSRVRSGFLEGSAVDAITEMVDVLAAERSFESAEKAVAAIDAVRRKSADAAHLK